MRPIAGILAVVLAGCWSAPSAVVKVGASDPGVPISGLSACTPGTHDPLELDPKRPLTVLVHGCNFSTGGFVKLAELFEAHGQQTVCFSYNDRDAIDAAARQLLAALRALEGRYAHGRVTVLGHSQGGLVARHALAEGRDLPGTPSRELQFRLVTVSAPFAGIRASRHCGLPWLHVASFGMTALACQVIAGNKWTEIFPGSGFITAPGSLAAAVSLHLRIASDERDGCQSRGSDGACLKSDSVFSLDEQCYDAIDAEPRVDKVEVQAGHAEIIGEWGLLPTKLIDVLQEKNILAQTPPERRAEIDALLRRLYGVAWRAAPLAPWAQAQPGQLRRPAAQ